MRAVRLTAYTLLILTAALVTAVVVIARNQRQIAEFALAQIHDRTGLEIQITGTRMGFGTHLTVVLANPRVVYSGKELARLDDIRAALSYRAIVHNYGLPLYRLTLDHPRIKLPVHQADVTVGGIPRLDPKMANGLKRGLDALSGTTMQVDINDAALVDSDGQGLVEHLDLHAYHGHYRPSGNWPWLLDFDATFSHPPVGGLQISGSVSLEAEGRPDTILAGQSRFAGFQLNDFAVGALKLSGASDGRLQFALDNSGALSGTSDLNLHKLALGGDALSQKMLLPDLEAVMRYRASVEQLDLSSVTLKRGSAQVLQAQATMLRPYDADRKLKFSASSAALDLNQIAGWLRAVRKLPPPLSAFVSRINDGTLRATSIGIDSTQPLRDWDSATLLQQLRAEWTIADGAYQLAAATKLPALHHLDAQLSYSAGRLKLSQGSFALGDSRFDQLSIDADLRNLKYPLHYRVRAQADLDLAELYPALSDRLRALSPAGAAHLGKLGGRSAITLDAADDFDPAAVTLPRQYLALIELDEITAGTIDPVSAIAIRQGQIKLTPKLIELDHVRVLPAGATGGDVTFNGSITPHPDTPILNDLAIELHGIAIERWLPLAIQADSLAADGSVGGVLHLNSGTHRVPTITGKLTFSDGHLRLGFLRAPLAARSATLTFDGTGLELNMPGSEFENQPVDFRLTVSDLSNPAVRLDATAANLDFLALNFIRLPWSPHRPPHFFAVPIAGHLAAHKATFDRLPLEELSTDFSRDATDWHVRNFSADGFKGHVSLAIDGRTGEDNWIHVIGAIAESDISSLFSMIDPAKPPSLTGKLSAKGDFWVNTDTDFFDTLAGTINLQAADGVLDRFTLLSRVLALIDLKSWLTAKILDPTVAGLPFNTISGDFKGVKGDFYTDDLRLDGPVMDIGASGDIQFGSSQVDMEVGVFPFKTANWIIHQIPIVGTNLAEGSSGLVAAYFHVHGPFKDPTVMPKPITSVTEFVKKMLGLPINIIKPNTIK